MARRNAKARGIVLLSVGMLVLSGCGATGAPKADPSDPAPGTSPSASRLASATPARVPLTIPACDVMNPVAQQEYEDYGPELFNAPAGETGLDVFSRVMPAAARQAMEAAPQKRGCRWPVHMQGAVTQYVAELAEADRVTLLAPLRDDEDSAESTLDGATVFTRTFPADDPMANETEVTQLFSGDAWIVIVDYAGQREYARAALEALRPAAREDASSGAGGDPGLGASAACSGLTGEQALARWGGEVPGSWDLTGRFSDVNGYDECAALSWMLLREDPCCTRFSPTAVLFFHRGEYVPVATEARFAVDAEKPVERLSDADVSVAFMWQGDDIAGPARQANSAYRWVEERGAVERTGQSHYDVKRHEYVTQAGPIAIGECSLRPDSGPSSPFVISCAITHPEKDFDGNAFLRRGYATESVSDKSRYDNLWEYSVRAFGGGCVYDPGAEAPAGEPETEIQIRVQDGVATIVWPDVIDDLVPGFTSAGRLEERAVKEECSGWSPERVGDVIHGIAPRDSDAEGTEVSLRF